MLFGRPRLRVKSEKKDDKNSKRNDIIIAGLTSYGGCCLIFRILLYSQAKRRFQEAGEMHPGAIISIKIIMPFQT